MIRIAILDPVLPSQVRERPEDLAGIDIGWSGSALTELRRVLPSVAPAVLVVSLDTLGPRPLEALEELEATPGVELVIVVYRFASREVLRSLEGEGRKTVKAPVSNGSLRAQMTSLLVREIFASSSASAAAAPLPTERPLGSAGSLLQPTARRDEAPRRLYSDDALGRLSETSTSVVCECPNHLATMLQSLVAFEQYARDCESRNAEDASIHAMLARETGHARHVLEEAMKTLLAHEGIVV